MADEADQELIEQLLDVFVFAPIGLALDARDLIPQLARRGRGHVDLLRVAGTLAARQGRGEAGKLFESFVDLVASRAAGESVGDPGGGGSSAAARARAEELARRPAAEIIRTLSQLDRSTLRALRDAESAGKARPTVLRRIDALLD